MNDHIDTPTRTPRTFRQKLVWPGMLFIMIGALVATDVTMVVIASNDPSFAVDKNYGEDGDGWEARKELERAGAERGWDVRSDLLINDFGQAELRVRLIDDEGYGIPDATIDVRAYHNARAAQKMEFFLLPTADQGHYVAAPQLDRSGRWTFDLEVTVDDVRWTPQLLHDVPESLINPATSKNTP